MTFNWSNEKTIDFLNQIHAHPEVWDVKTDLYKNRDLRKDGWIEISEKFEITTDEAYRKFKSLRTYAKNEEKKKKRTFGGSKAVKWFAYDAISFILDQDANSELDSSDVAVTADETKPRKPVIKVFVDQEEVTESEATGSSFSSVTSKKPRLTIIPKPESFRTKTRYKNTSNVQEGEINDYGPFGEHIANKLSKYDPYTRAQAEMKIMQILYDCDMQMLTNEAEELVPVTVVSDSQSD